MSMFTHLLGLSNLSPRRSQLSVAVMLSAPGFGQLRASDSDVSHMLEAVPSNKTVAQSKANGHDFDEFSVNILYIYIYGQVRLTCLPKKYCNISLY